MALFRCASSGGGASQTIDFNYVKNIVDSHTHTYDFTVVSNRATVNAGGVYVDTTNKVVYLYADFTMLTTSAPSSYNTLLNIANEALTPYVPSSGSNLPFKLLNIESSTQATPPAFYVYWISTAPKTRIGHTGSANSGSRFVLWGVWALNS